MADSAPPIPPIPAIKVKRIAEPQSTDPATLTTSAVTAAASPAATKDQVVETVDGWPTEPASYKISGEIGSGAFAKVHIAKCESKGTFVALKIMNLEQVTVNLDHLRQEVTTMKLCKHPNVLPLHNCFNVKSELWLVMPYMNMGSCLEVMRQRKKHGKSELEEECIAAILKGAVEGLAYLHKSGWIHRDIKSGNILLDDKGNVMLADFGVAGIIKSRDPTDPAEMRNTFVGTPCWMAPEVMKQAKGYTEKADIWSLGITALELAKSYAPYAREKTMKVLLRTLQEEPPSLDTYQVYGDTGKKTSDFSRPFINLYKRMLIKDPVKRPTAKDLMKDRFLRCKNPNQVLMKSLIPSLTQLIDLKSLEKSMKQAVVVDAGASGIMDSGLMDGWMDPEKPQGAQQFTMADKFKNSSSSTDVKKNMSALESVFGDGDDDDDDDE